MDDPVAEAQLLDYWHYAHNGESYGPVSGDEINAMLRGKQLPPTILVWREGMEGFVQVTTFAGLIQGVKVPIRQILATIADILRGESGIVGVGACFAQTGMLGGIYAAIYLPLRWKTLMRLPQHFRVMGLIGGFGLIALFALSIALGVFAVAVGM